MTTCISGNHISSWLDDLTLTCTACTVLVSFDFVVIRLESKLRSFACLTKGDIVGIEYNNKVLVCVCVIDLDAAAKSVPFVTDI